MSAAPMRADMSLDQLEATVSAAIACDPILLRMMETLREGHDDGMDASKFGRLLRLAIESAYLSGMQAGMRVTR